MFYAEVPLFHALVVFGVVIGCYLFFNRLTEKSKRVEQWLEGKPACLIEAGEINLSAFQGENLTYQELFGELRQQGIQHLGQLRKVYLEATGEISVYFFTDEEVQPGLPIFPELLAFPLRQIDQADLYACITCGNRQSLLPAKEVECQRCQSKQWLSSCCSRRIT